VKRILAKLWPAGWVVLVVVGVALGPLALGDQLSDKAFAEQVLAAAGSSSAEAALLRTPLDEAKKALQRADGARKSGDVPHAELLEGLAREWAETARDLARAAAIEADAGALESSASQASLRAEKARALLEEAISRRGRAEVELEKLSANAGPFPPKPPPTALPRSKAPKPRAAPASSASKGAP
jgi:colicin import membrane protein